MIHSSWEVNKLRQLHHRDVCLASVKRRLVIVNHQNAFLQSRLVYLTSVLISFVFLSNYYSAFSHGQRYGIHYPSFCKYLKIILEIVELDRYVAILECVVVQG